MPIVARTGMFLVQEPMFAELIKELTGLTAESVGIATVERAIKARMDALGISEDAYYLATVQKSPTEKQNLINEITVPETWFFRDVEPFRLLENYATRVWLPQRRDEVFRVLSIPCSSGEEPYSIVMTLLDAGLAPKSFAVDAVDISTRVIKIAKTGIYGRNSFRGDDLDFRDDYFDEKPDGYHILPVVKERVRFRLGNLLDDAFMQRLGTYHAIFCRNLLIYFDVDSKQHALNSIHKCLHPDGVLFLGHAETGRGVLSLFRPIRHPGAFAYQKATAPANGEGSDKKGSRIEVPFRASSTQPETGKVFASGKVRAPLAAKAAETVDLPAAVASDREDHLLERIRHMADAGQTGEAAVLCEDFVRSHPEQAEAHYLLALIRMAQERDSEAAELFRKAVYLNPAHYESLVCLATLADEQGNGRAASAYRARAERARRNDSEL